MVPSVGEQDDDGAVRVGLTVLFDQVHGLIQRFLRSQAPIIRESQDCHIGFLVVGIARIASVRGPRSALDLVVLSSFYLEDERVIRGHGSSPQHPDGAVTLIGFRVEWR